MFARRRLERKIDALNVKVDVLLDHFGIQQLPALPVVPIKPAPAAAHSGAGSFAEVDELMAQGKKIQAIKRYRELTGAGLKEAKDAVEHRYPY
ncbi:ribosomal protein L7/L12 [Nocardia sp. NPDC049149]|uniref:ribosomal protein L7/L12 n=1 Tax=Nocardia sp. NPDC049149 TaxID=3364315 RepID=UPI003715E1B5